MANQDKESNNANSNNINSYFDPENIESINSYFNPDNWEDTGKKESKSNEIKDRSWEVIQFILAHIKNGTVDGVFNDSTLNVAYNYYDLKTHGIRISVELLTDIKNNPEFYQKLVDSEE